MDANMVQNRFLSTWLKSSSQSGAAKGRGEVVRSINECKLSVGQTDTSTSTSSESSSSGTGGGGFGEEVVEEMERA